MNQKQLSLISSVLTLAFAQISLAAVSRLPNWEGESKVGRMPLFESKFGQSWVLPTAFSTELNCSSGATDLTTCQVRVINTLSDLESSDLEAKKTVGYMSPFDAGLNMEIHEAFDFKWAQGTMKPSISGQLAVLPPHTPYASLAVRIKSSEREALVQAYENGGIGIFRSNISFDAIRVFDYLAIGNGSQLRSLLLKLDGRTFSKSELELALHEVVNKLQIQSEDPASAFDLQEVASYLRRQHFVHVKKGRLRLLKNSLPSGTDPIVIRETQTRGRVKCEVSIELSQNSQPLATCEIE